MMLNINEDDTCSVCEQLTYNCICEYLEEFNDLDDGYLELEDSEYEKDTKDLVSGRKQISFMEEL